MNIFSFIFRKQVGKTPIDDFLKIKFGISPKDSSIYELALRHRSSSKKSKTGVSLNNERLEFLGDSVLDAVVTEFLYIHYPTEDEGYLTKLRSKIVSRSMLSKMAEKMELSKVLTFNLGQKDNSDTIYGNALEAIIGAMYLEQGYEKTRDIVLKKILLKNIDIKKLESQSSDFKSLAIEWAQKNQYSFRFDTVVLDSKPPMTSYESKMIINDEVRGYGQGMSKKKAEQEAAKAVCTSLNIG